MKLDFKVVLYHNEIDMPDMNAFFGTTDIDYEINNLFACINYSIGLDLKEWGIKGMDTEISNIVVNADISVKKEFITQPEIDLLISKGFKEYSDSLTLFNWQLTNFSEISICDPIIRADQITIHSLTVDISDKGFTATIE